MPKLTPVVLLALFIMSNDKSRKHSYEDSYEDLDLKYKAPQRKKNTDEEPGTIRISGQWIHQNTYVIHSEAGLSPEEITERLIGVSTSYIECLEEKINYTEEAIFDFPLRGWLYHTFADKDNTMRSFFDTEVEEHWVLPNVYCNSNNVLSAVSWMISPRSMSLNANKGMQARFRDKPRPPFDKKSAAYGEQQLENSYRQGKGGVYCDWGGWLYASNDGDYKFWFDTNGAEKFTFVNVYCHPRTNTVRYFYRRAAWANSQHFGLREFYIPVSRTNNQHIAVVGEYITCSEIASCVFIDYCLTCKIPVLRAHRVIYATASYRAAE